MIWSQEMEWQGYQLSLTRGESQAKSQITSVLPPGPGAGEVCFSALSLTTRQEAIQLQVALSGKINRAFLEIYLECEDGWLAGPVCRQTLKPPATREIGGVAIPIWTDNSPLHALWQPHIHLLVSGEDAAWAFAQPMQPDAKKLWLHALWVSADSALPVRLHFTNGGIFDHMTIISSGDALPGGSRGLSPHPDDHIIPSFTWLRREGDLQETAPGSSNALTISEHPPHLETISAPPGRYHTGLLAFDLDGQAHRSDAIAFIMTEDNTIELGEG